MRPKSFLRAHDIALRHRATAGKRPLAQQDDASKGKLYIYEVIGEDWWTGGGVTAKKVADALEAMKGVKTLDIFINSEGGDVFEAKAIYANLVRFDAEKVVHVDGIAASAATFIAMAGTRILTAPAATWMIHDPWCLSLGNADDLRKMADVLDLEATAIAETYAKRTGLTPDECREKMRAETWMSAKDALELGFTDAIDGADEPPAETAPDEEQPAAALAALVARTQERLEAHGRSALRAALASRAAQLTSRASPGLKSP